MIAIEISEIKNFMGELLISENYDQLLLEKAEVLTSFRLEISGKRNKNWYDQEHWQRMEQLAGSDASWMTWKECKPVILQYIKGKQPPDKMRIVLKLQRKQADALMRESGAQQVYQAYQPGLCLQIRYEQGSLQLVTGTSFSEFSMDKTVEQAWDDIVRKRLEKSGLCLPNRE